jgi:hypothetical protein
MQTATSGRVESTNQKHQWSKHVAAFRLASSTSTVSLPSIASLARSDHQLSQLSGRASLVLKAILVAGDWNQPFIIHGFILSEIHQSK